MVQRWNRDPTNAWAHSTRQMLDQAAAWQQTMLEVWREAQRQWMSLWTAGPKRGWRRPSTRPQWRRPER